MGLSLLIVDDDPEISSFIAHRIRSESPQFSIAAVESGKDCLEYLKSSHIDCILSDYQMPGMDGMELLNTLRSQGNSVPFIFITAQGSEEVAREAFKNGADDYFTKDIGFAHFSRILNSVEQSVKKSRAERMKSDAEVALQDREERLRALFESADDGIFLQREGVFVDCNSRGVEMYGYESKSDIIGHHPMEFAPPVQPDGESSEEKAVRFITAALSGVSQKFYWKPQRRDGTLFDVEVSLSRLNLKGKTYIQAIVRDISARKKAEEALHDSEERFRTLFESADDGIFLADGAVFLDCNSKAVGMYGFNEKNEILGHNPLEYSPAMQPDGSDSAEKLHKLITDTLNGAPQKCYWQSKRKDGTLFDVEVSLNTLKLKGKTYIQAIVRDIAERKKMEESLKESEERFRTLFESADDGIFLVDGPVFVDCNSRGVGMYGFDDKSEILGRSFLELAPICQPSGENSEEMARGVIPIVLNGTPQKFTWTSFRRDGTLFDTEVSLNRFYLKGKTYVQAIVRDITARKQAEEALILKNVILSAQQEATLDGILIVDPDGKIISYNKRFIEIWNIPIPQEVEDTRSDELAIKSVLQYLEKPEEFLERINYLYEHRTETCRDEIQLKDGRTLDRYTAPMFGNDDRYYGRVWYFRDITEKKNLERQRADFYAMVTHDLKSPLTAILGYSSLISEAAKDKAEAGIEEMAKAVARGGKKLMRLADDFLAAGMEPGSILIRQVPVDVAGLLREVRDDFGPLKRQKGIVFRVDISDNLPAASLDKKHFERAVGNLLQNAFNYTPKGGKITLKAEAASYGQGRYVIVSVSDNGPGIAPEEQGKIFNKYYRSPKTAGIKGTGLGLAIVKAVAEAHGGRVELESEVGKGSTFRLVLPVAHNPA